MSTYYSPRPRHKPPKARQSARGRVGATCWTIWQAFGCACYYCGRSLSKNEATVDHVYPRSLGRFTEDIENLVCSCQTCNQAKADKVPCEWAQVARGEGFAGEHVKPWAELLAWGESAQTWQWAIAPFTGWSVADKVEGKP